MPSPQVPHPQQGVLLPEDEEEGVWEFMHPYFQRNRPELLVHVRRKHGREPKDLQAPPPSMPPLVAASEVKGDAVALANSTHILSELAAIKQQQALITSTLEGLQRENQAVWAEMMASRQRLQRQQQTTMKILQFLASVYVKGDKKNLRPGAASSRLLLASPQPPNAHAPTPGGAAAAPGPSVLDISGTVAGADASRAPSEPPHEPSSITTPSTFRSMALGGPTSPRPTALLEGGGGFSSSPSSPSPFANMDPEEIQRHILELMSPEVRLAWGTVALGK